MEKLKKKTTELLASMGIDVPEHLPQIEALDEVNPRSTQDIAGRLCALAYVIGLGFNASEKGLVEQLNKHHLMPYVSDYEKQVLRQDVISPQDKTNMTWLPECAQALAWCLGLVDLNHSQHCDEDLAGKIPFEKDPANFINNATRRDLSEIQEQSDLLYRMHWYARNCRLTGKECEFNEEIISERRKAIDWVYGIEEDWDEVPLDT